MGTSRPITLTIEEKELLASELERWLGEVGRTLCRPACGTGAAR